VEEKPTHAVRSFLIELIVYAGLVIVYVLFVIALLGGWLYGLYEHHKIRYAFSALLLIIGQGVVLEMVTSFLLRLIRSHTEDGD
jgi:NADH:ubiquinone oxidoreductase subunit 6 (subunit J)